MRVSVRDTPLPLAEQMFAEATWWHLASHILYAYGQTTRTIERLPGVPAIHKQGAVPLLSVASPVGAFALELYFKAATVAVGRDPKDSHSLASLYRGLDTRLKRDIRERYQKWRMQNPGWEQWWASQGTSTKFEDVMADSSEAFTQFRYMAEHAHHPTKPVKEFAFLAWPITDGTRAALVAKYPPWAKHTAPHAEQTVFRTHPPANGSPSKPHP